MSIPSFYYLTHFHFHVSNYATLLDFVQRYRVHQSITKHNVDSYHALTPMSCNVPMHKCNAMRHCMSIPCHICDECYMDNTNHTFYHVSWTIISKAYNFQNKHSSNFQYIKTHISARTTKHVITIPIITP